MKKINKSFRRILLYTTLLFISSYSFGQKPGKYTVTGHIDGATKFYLYKNGYRSGIVNDSIESKNGDFTFKGSVPDISIAEIEVSGDNVFQIIGLFLEEGNINISKFGTSYIASGTIDNDQSKKFETQKSLLDSATLIQPYYDNLNRIDEILFHLRKSPNPPADSIKLYEDSINAISAPIDKYMAFRRNKIMQFIKENPQTYTSARMMLNMLSDDTSTLFKLYRNLGPKIQNSKIGQTLLNQLEGNIPLESGTPAPTFTSTDVNGKKISLSDFKGKYVLLDFWATWCGPCRAGNPHLIELYNKYHDKGLEIIGVASDDNNVDGWKKAIQTDKIGIWHQILDHTKAEDNSTFSIGKTYKVSALPTEYIIDKEGNIYTIVDASSIDATLQQIFK